MRGGQTSVTSSRRREFVSRFRRKSDTLSLLRNLETMHAWAKENVPGGELRFLGCDFRSAQQGHGDRVLVDALRQLDLLGCRKSGNNQ